MHITLKPLNSFSIFQEALSTAADQNASGSNLIEQEQSDQRRVTKRWVTRASSGGSRSLFQQE